MQLVHFLTSEPVAKNSQTPFYASSNTMGYLANCSPSPFGEGWGEAVPGVFQAAFSSFRLLNYTGVSCYLFSLSLRRGSGRGFFSLKQKTPKGLGAALRGCFITRKTVCSDRKDGLSQS